MENIWLPGLSESSPRVLRLFCFPHAGGGTSSFAAWRRLMPPEIQICPVRLPGRESRLQEAPFHSLSELLDALTGVIAPHLAGPFAFFGHSMGALVAFELSRRVKRVLGHAPLHLFVSGARAPRSPRREERLAELADADFVAEIRRRFGADAIPPSPEVIRLILPTLRSDVRLLETYRFEELLGPVESPLTAFSGREDSYVQPDDLLAWACHTSGPFHSALFPGGHFFVYKPPLAVPLKMAETLTAALAGRQVAAGGSSHGR